MNVPRLHCQHRIFIAALVAVAWQTLGCERPTNVVLEEEPVISRSVREEPTGPSDFTPAMTADATGGIHLVWMQSTPAKNAILYSRYKDDVWSPPITISDDQVGPLFPEIAVGSAGKAHVTWVDRLGDDADVYHVQSAGNEWTKPEIVCDTEGISQRPQIAVANDGTAHIVWYDNSDGSFHLFHSYLSGSTWSEATRTHLVDLLITHDPGMNMMPALTVDQAGHAHIVFVNLGAVGVMDLFHSRWDGETWSEPVNITQYPAPKGRPRAVNNIDGPGIITWEGDTPPKPNQPCIGVDRSGNLLVAWENRGEVWYANSDGQDWPKSFHLSEGTQGSLWPELRSAPEGVVHVTWTSQVSEVSQIFHRQFRDVWSEAVQVSHTPVASAFSALAIDHSGAPHFAWMEASNGSYEIVHRHGLSTKDLNPVSRAD